MNNVERDEAVEQRLCTPPCSGCQTKDKKIAELEAIVKIALEASDYWAGVRNHAHNECNCSQCVQWRKLNTAAKTAKVGR